MKRHPSPSEPAHHLAAVESTRNQAEIRIEVVADPHIISAQARSYAEYRVFAALTRHTQGVRSARIVLRRAGESGATDNVTCAVTVTLNPAGSLRIRAIGPHPYAVINRAVERIGGAMSKRAERRALQCDARPLSK